MIKSPLRYPGGKSKVAAQIASLIPDFMEFREPFLGGGSVFFYLKQHFPHKKFWVNDLYSELFIFWQASSQNIDDVVKQVYKWKREWLDGKKLYDFLLSNIESFENVEKAAAFFIFNRITFSGTTLSGGYSEQAFKGRFTDSSIERLRNIGPLLNETEITNYDYKKVVETGGDNVFIFLDPPYHSATKSALYGKNGDLHKSFDHVRFAEIMKTCNHKWLITYDDSPYIRELFSFANIINWDLTYGMRNVSKLSEQKVSELFISNYAISSCKPKQEALEFLY